MPEKRTTYHHGDLRAALVTAGIGLARKGGPQAVVLREVTRLVGVAPNSAYGHFKTLAALRSAVTLQAQSEMGEAMGRHLDAVDAAAPADPRAAAKAYLREVGRSYIRFALDEPGLFRTAMGGSPVGLRIPGTPEDVRIAGDRREPDSFLLRALTRLIETGSLRPEDLGPAVIAHWATVHGLATMFLDLLAPMTDAQRESTIDDALDVLVDGLTARRTGSAA
ncbi:TetR/AcrR family transcriptional regulator [Catenuloplanes indicus]|uniref:AcrR family transcriptional regulator n=1 Tax=Catenuloplanes indicus TaxID=137267 RepID=A0AAE3W6W0_9ACTN|nr:TetR-like C-terminal domain-containing protein [Catenuloplanes indicus]MDQ0369734.1 AcrR family transcriptional regulator [Catenuloplanes indicus]